MKPLGNWVRVKLDLTGHTSHPALITSTLFWDHGFSKPGVIWRQQDKPLSLLKIPDGLNPHQVEKRDQGR